MKTIFAITATAAALTAGAAFAQTTTTTVVTPVQPAQAPVVVAQPPVQVQTTEPATTGSGAASGATTGAIAGAVVGGPVGAVVGGLAGAVTGEVAESALTPETKTYVTQNPVQSVPVTGTVTVGTTLPQTVQVQQIPDSQYEYVYVNDQPVIVEPQTRKVVYIAN